MGITDRKYLIELLKDDWLDSLELSAEAGIPEKEVYAHLSHIQRSLKNSGQRLNMVPAECRSCGYVFKKRKRLEKPGKCPICKKTYIAPPRFMVERIAEKGVKTGR